MKLRSLSGDASNRLLRLIVLTAVVLMALPAAAQTADSGKWEVEIHGGGLLATNPTAGTVSLPGTGESFSNTGDQGVARTSRRESSWYFGDGTVLFNQIGSAINDAIRRGNTAIVRNPALGLSPRIVALDPVLGRSLGEQHWCACRLCGRRCVFESRIRARRSRRCWRTRALHPQA